ncbi:hypothetical protein CROQUDRAFT_133991 [Cronartium quercuum f. sp. fusiforme G11]|uniref:Carboxylic ester hydrolase n=1 Tax=Cronartium quercuum f. sp. fusiforme G11 TaxID=708437 RepID=A0A9P6NG77_9BASI|nr:hypothetical protein CROQUDRAFT_133991 [Cronartium quercuum f. sp. fusiforme G11]
MRATIVILSSTLCLIAAVQAVDTLVDLGHAKYQGLKVGKNVNQWLSVRYAAPCDGANRFKPPQPVLNQTTIVDATVQGALCLSKNSQEGNQYDSPRQAMKEDCLYMSIYAPANAKTTSMVPIMFFIQGGGFGSNSNGNFNGTGLVESSGGKLMVVGINYRVGILGFLAGAEVAKGTSGATPNNGLRDMIAAARFIKEHATAFGGDPNHIVLSGVSSGAEAINILLTSNNGTGWPDLFVGAAVQSPGIFPTGTPADRDSAFKNNLNNPKAATEKDISSMIKSTVPSITQEVLAKVLEAFPSSLNKISFFGRDVSPRANASLRLGTGAEWQRDAAIKTELKTVCTANFFSDMNSMVKNKANWHYRWNLLDESIGGAADKGLFSPHAQELYGIWGANNTDGGDPGCFADGTCVEAIKIVQSYWISFILSLDPNKRRAPGTPIWKTWSVKTPCRIVFDNHNATMEVVGTGIGEVSIAGLNERQRCVGLMMPLAKAVALNLPEGGVLPGFANGARTDPTLVVFERARGFSLKSSNHSKQHLSVNR